MKLLIRCVAKALPMPRYVSSLLGMHRLPEQVSVKLFALVLEEILSLVHFPSKLSSSSCKMYVEQHLPLWFSLIPEFSIC